MGKIRIRTEEECRQHIETIFPEKSERHREIEILNIMLMDIQKFMLYLDQHLKHGAYPTVFSSQLSRDVFCSHIRAINALIRVVRQPLIESAAEECSGDVTLRDIDSEGIAKIHAMLVDVVDKMAF